MADRSDRQAAHGCLPRHGRQRARAGLNVIVDEVLLSEDDWIGWQQELEGLDVLWVRVDGALDVVEAREKERGDRMIGMARAQFDIVHRYPAYGVRVGHSHR